MLFVLLTKNERASIKVIHAGNSICIDLREGQWARQDYKISLIFNHALIRYVVTKCGSRSSN